MSEWSLPSLEDRVRAALAEDVGDGDRTTDWTIDADAPGRARMVCKQEGVVSGLDVVGLVFSCVDRDLRVERKTRDGERVSQGTVIATVEGRLASILHGERTALNLLGRLSGIATLTRRFVDAVRDVEGQGEILILDTRKTTPLWRDVEKKAVLAGGGTNHRMGLYDAVLIKDNHIDACDGIAEAVQKVRERNREGIQVGVEARSLDDVRAAANEKVDYILVDNMTPDEMREAVRIAGEIPVEASGGISLQNIRAIAQTGVRRISIGALTHSAPALDFSLLVDRFL